MNLSRTCPSFSSLGDASSASLGTSRDKFSVAGISNSSILETEPVWLKPMAFKIMSLSDKYGGLKTSATSFQGSEIRQFSNGRQTGRRSKPKDNRFFGFWGLTGKRGLCNIGTLVE